MRTSVKICFSFVFLFVLQATQVKAEIIDVFGPIHIDGISPFYHLTVTFPKTPVGNCVQNNGKGDFSTVTYDIDDRSKTYSRIYSCVYPFITLSEMKQSRFVSELLRLDQISHDYFENGKNENPNYSNPDRNSNRHLLKTQDGLVFKPATLSGRGINSETIKESPFGRDAYYYQIQVICGLDQNNNSIKSLQDLNNICSESRILEAAAEYTTGPETVLFLGVDSPHH